MAQTHIIDLFARFSCKGPSAIYLRTKEWRSKGGVCSLVHAFSNDEIAVVAQYYDTDVNKEYAIRGNSAILKCVVPSFVADFVKILSWHTDQGEEFVPGDDYGIPRGVSLNLTSD